MTKAAKDAGYAKSTAEKKSSAILNRTLVQSELTKAMERLGINYGRIVRPIVDGLKANRSVVVNGIPMVESEIPDHQTRLAAHDRAVKLLGGIPKIGETIPASSGLNLFISVDNAQRPLLETPPSPTAALDQTAEDWVQILMRLLRATQRRDHPPSIPGRGRRDWSGCWGRRNCLRRRGYLSSQGRTGSCSACHDNFSADHRAWARRWRKDSPRIGC